MKQQSSIMKMEALVVAFSRLELFMPSLLKSKMVRVYVSVQHNFSFLDFSTTTGHIWMKIGYLVLRICMVGLFWLLSATPFMTIVWSNIVGCWRCFTLMLFVSSVTENLLKIFLKPNFNLALAYLLTQMLVRKINLVF